MSNDIRTGYEAAAKAITERAGGHYKAGNYDLQDECLQCAAMLHDLKPVAAPSVANGAAELPPLPEFPAHARLYYTGVGRKYRRAATTPGAGEPLVLVEEAKRIAKQYASAAIASAQQAAPKQALTDEQIELIFQKTWSIPVPQDDYRYGDFARKARIDFARAIEAAAGPNALLVAALKEAVDVIDDYLAYDHDGDPWKEDARTMGEMDINDYAHDGRLEKARAALASIPTAPEAP